MRSLGFSLMELLVTLVIISTLSCLAQPIASLISKHRVLGNATQLATELRYARTRAVLEQTGITIRAINDNWSLGWQTFADPNRNAQRDPGERLITTHLIKNDALIHGNRTVNSYVHFAMSGEPQLRNGGFQAGTLTFCSISAPSERYLLILGKSGRIRIKQDARTRPCE